MVPLSRPVRWRHSNEKTERSPVEIVELKLGRCTWNTLYSLALCSVLAPARNTSLSNYDLRALLRNSLDHGSTPSTNQENEPYLTEELIFLAGDRVPEYNHYETGPINCQRS